MENENEVVKDVKPKPRKAKPKTATYAPKRTRWLIRKNGNAIKLFAGQPFEATDAEAITLCNEAEIPKA